MAESEDNMKKIYELEVGKDDAFAKAVNEFYEKHYCTKKEPDENIIVADGKKYDKRYYKG